MLAARATRSHPVDALRLGRTCQDLHLIKGSQLIDRLFEQYEGLDPEWKRLLPLRRVHAVDPGRRFMSVATAVVVNPSAQEP